MSQANVVLVYANQIFKKLLGKKIKISRHESIEDRVIETKEEIPRKAELEVYQLAEKPEYDIHLIIPQKTNNKPNNYFELIIQNITAEEMKMVCEGFSEIYKGLSRKKQKC